MKKLTSETIKEHVGEKVSADFILRGAELVTTSKTKFLKIVLTDADGAVRGKVWKENIDPEYESLIGKPVRVTGSVSAYDDTVEIHAETMKELSEPEGADLVRSMPKNAIAIAQAFILSAVKGLGDIRLKEFMEQFVTKERMSYVKKLYDSSLSFEGGMLIELAGAIRMVNAAYEVSDCTFAGLKADGREIMICALIAYYFGFAYAQEEKGSVMQRSDKGRFLGEGFCGAMLTDKLYALKLAQDNKQGRETVDIRTVRSLEHICLVLGDGAEALTDEARILKELYRTYRFIIREGGITDGDTGK